MSSSRASARTYVVALRAMAILTLALGVAYPLAMTGIGQLALSAQANGSERYATPGGPVVGSALIGQAFTDADGAPLPEFFQSRPSAAGDGYDGGSSSGTNYGPENPDFIAAVIERRAQIAEFNKVDPATVPVDALTASSSGLDPHISPAYARLQVERVALARGLSPAVVSDLVEDNVQGRDLGIMGDPTVNVLELNIALQASALNAGTPAPGKG